MLSGRFLLPVLVAATITVTGCGGLGATGTTESPTAAMSASDTSGTTAAAAASTASGAATSTASLAATHEDQADLTWDEGSETAITLADAGSTRGPRVTVDGSIVTITAPGTYRIDGSLSDGSLMVDSAGDGVVRLVLDGWELGIRPIRISKFGTSLAAMRPDLPANRWTPALRRRWVAGPVSLQIPSPAGRDALAVPGCRPVPGVVQ